MEEKLNLESGREPQDLLMLKGRRHRVATSAWLPREAIVEAKRGKRSIPAEAAVNMTDSIDLLNYTFVSDANKLKDDNDLLTASGDFEPRRREIEGEEATFP